MRPAVTLTVLLACSSVATAQSATVRVSGTRTFTISSAELGAMPHTTINTTDHGQPVVYEGVLIRELLTRAGVPEGEKLRGRELATAVVVTGADGYKVAFGVAEFDPGLADGLSILADRKDGAALTGSDAPFQLVLTGEKHPARWVRQVVAIDILPLAR
jgi:hypothetical protein